MLARFAVRRLARELRSGRRLGNLDALLDAGMVGDRRINERAIAELLGAADAHLEVATSAIVGCVGRVANGPPSRDAPCWADRGRPLDDDEVWDALLAPLLLAPAKTLHRPAQRIIAVLEASHDLWRRASSPHGHSWTQPASHLADDLIRYAVRRNEQCPADLVEVLARTDHPVLLDSLHRSLREDHDLVLAAMISNNPHVLGRVTGPGRDGEPVVAVLLGRSELVTTVSDIWELADVVAKSTSEPAVELCSAVLRDLPPGKLRDKLCTIATTGTTVAPAARHIVVEQDFTPLDPDQHLLFFFLTEQWDRYEALDPTGEVLYEQWEQRWNATRRESWAEAGRISRVARSAGRPDPEDRWRTDNPDDPAPEGSYRAWQRAPLPPGSGRPSQGTYHTHPGGLHT